MNYEEKFYEKFGNKNFEFLEQIRDKNVKKTYLKLKCKICESIELKEQYLLFKNDKIICHNCTNRKKSDKLNIEEELKKIEKVFNIKINSFLKIDNKIKLFLNCSNCDDEFSYSLYSFTKKNITIKYINLCKKCSEKNREFKNKYDTKDVKKWFTDKGIEPLFEEYKNAYTYLDLKCKCGNIFKMTFKNRLHYNDDYIPKCDDCKKIDKLNKYDYSYNRYTHRKKDRVWSKMIKNKFNNRCIIIGDYKNIISHHLNGYKKYPDLRYDINNGVTLSEELHKEFHLKYDNYKGDCTFEQFKEFYELKTNKKLILNNNES